MSEYSQGTSPLNMEPVLLNAPECINTQFTIVLQKRYQDSYRGSSLPLGATEWARYAASLPASDALRCGGWIVNALPQQDVQAPEPPTVQIDAIEQERQRFRQLWLNSDQEVQESCAKAVRKKQVSMFDESLSTTTNPIIAPAAQVLPGITPPSGFQPPPGINGPPPGFQIPPGIHGHLGFQSQPGTTGASGFQTPSGIHEIHGIAAQRGQSSPPGFQPPPVINRPLGFQPPPGTNRPSGFQPPPGTNKPPEFQPPPGINRPPGFQPPPGFQSVSEMQTAYHSEKLVNNQEAQQMSKRKGEAQQPLAQNDVQQRNEVNYQPHPISNGYSANVGGNQPSYQHGLPPSHTFPTQQYHNKSSHQTIQSQRFVSAGTFSIEPSGEGGRTNKAINQFRHLPNSNLVSSTSSQRLQNTGAAMKYPPNYIADPMGMYGTIPPGLSTQAANHFASRAHDIELERQQYQAKWNGKNGVS